MNQILPRVFPEDVGIPSRVILDFLEELESYEHTELHGLMIMRHGKVCAEGWWFPYTPGRAHICWSLGKTYTATAIGLAITDKLLTLDTRLIDIFPDLVPEMPCENLSKICIRHLLSMSGGMKTMSSEGPGWLPRFIQTEVEFEPGTVFMYNSMGTNTLGAVIKRVTGEDMEDYLRKKLGEKLGMNLDEMYWTRIPDDAPWAAGGLYSCTENNLRLMQLYLQGGKWNGEQILDPEYVRQATTMQIDNTIGYTPEWTRQTSPEATVGYGFQIWMCSYPGAYRADGASGQYSIVFPDLDMVVAINETCPDQHTAEVLQIVYDKLARQINPSGGAIPYSEETKLLEKKLGSLSLKHTPYAPFSPMIEKIQGKCFKNQSGRYTLLTAFQPREYRGTDIEVTNGMDLLSFSFENRTCSLSYMENGRAWEMMVALDGAGIENKIDIPRHTPTDVLLSGFWQTETLFVVKARWIETSVEKTVWFEFGDNCVDVHGKLTTGLLGAYALPNEVAHAVII